MRKINWFLLLAGFSLVIFGKSFANDGCVDPRISCKSSTCFLDDFAVAIDALWWKPCLDNLNYATVTCETDTKAKIAYKGLCPDYHAGLHVVLGRPSFYCDWGFLASYTYFNAHASHKFSDAGKIGCPLIHPLVLPCITEPYDKVSASTNFFYNEWDALITYDMSCCNIHHLFQPFVGLAGLNFKQKMHIDLFQGVYDDKIKWESDFWGVGLRAGIEYQYLFCNRLRFFTIVHGTMLAGDADNNEHQKFCKELKIKDNECCWFVPGYHIGVGFIYDTCICHIKTSLRIGYDFVEWRNLPNPRIFVGDFNPADQGRSTPTNTRTLGMQGVSLGAAIIF